MGTKFEVDNSGNATILGNLAVDTNVLKVDSSGNMVGINKTTPAVALDVVGAITATGTITGNLTGTVTGNATNVSGTVAIGNGGTGQTTAATAINALVPVQTGLVGNVLTTNGSAVSWQPGGLSALIPTQQTSPNMTVLVGAGTYIKSTGQGAVTFAGGSSPSFSSAGISAGQSRVDLLCISDLGVLSVSQGVAATTGSQVAPAYPSDRQTLAEITLVNAQSTIVTANIRDTRGFLNMGSAGAVEYVEHYTVGTASGNYGGVSTTVFPTVNAFTANGKNLEVYYDGVKMRPGYEYNENSTNQITFVSARTVGHSVSFKWTLGAVIPATMANQYREDFTATAGQQDFYLTQSYVNNGKNLQVYQGVLLTKGQDYTEPGTNLVHFVNPMLGGEKVSFVWQYAAAAVPANVNDHRQAFVATVGQVTFNLTQSYIMGGSNLIVTVGGIVMTPSVDYDEINANQVTFKPAAAMVGGEQVSFIYKTSTPSGDAMTVGGFSVNATPTANNILPLDADAHVAESSLVHANGATRLGYIVGVVAVNFIGTYRYGYKHIARQTSIIRNIGVWVTAANNTHVVYGIYSDNAGVPGTLLAQTSELTVTAGVDDGSEKTGVLNTPVQITAGAAYWLVWQNDGTAFEVWTGTSTASTAYRVKRSTVTWSATLPPTWIPAETHTQMASIFAY